MKASFAMIVGALPLLLPGAAVAQGGNMMNTGNWGGGWMGGVGGMGGYAGPWTSALLVIAVLVLLALVITQKRK
ncbi:MAG: hypothetical protein IH604_13130 [Burkholderiales bacterium]|nr:hypothetical protein [Burkholderiales bacterium]